MDETIYELDGKHCRYFLVAERDRRPGEGLAGGRDRDALFAASRLLDPSPLLQRRFTWTEPFGDSRPI